MDFDYTLEPGRKLDKIPKVINENKPIISIITPFYSGQEYIEQLANSILNQTYPYFEWLIINDGIKDDDSLKLLEKIKKMDSRIKVFHKENSGLAATRDYGASLASECTKYLFFIDDDDLMEKTYLECAYFTLETNPYAAFAYADCVGFGTQNYTWSKWFNLKEEKKANMLVATALIRKDIFLSLGGYGTREKGINEDWVFWMKLFSKGYFPVRMSYYAFWYRRKEQGELNKSKGKKNQKKTRKLLNENIKNIKKNVEAIQYPNASYDWNDAFDVNIDNLILPKYEDNKKIKILMIIPWITMGGADKFNLNLISNIDHEKYEFIVVTTDPGINKWRQKLEQSASIVYDLTSFLDRKYWHLFIANIIKARNIDIIFNTNSTYGYEILPYLKGEFSNIPIMDYIHMEEWYNRNGGYSRDSSAVSSVISRTLTCNKNSERILHEYFKRDKEKLNTVYIGVDEKQFDPKKYDAKQLKKKYMIEEDKFIINFICRIDTQKRPLLFVEIIKELYNRNKDFIVLVAGDGPLLNIVKSKCKHYNLDNNVRFLGAVKNTQEIYAISDLSLNCSIKEGLALTSYESLSMGVPVISSDVGGQRELIDETVGAVVPCLQKESEIEDFNYSKEEVNSYVDEIIKVIDKKDKYKNNSRKKILSGFTYDQMIENMDKEFQNVLKSKPINISCNKDICIELINLYLLADTKRYEYMCDVFNKQLFGMEHYKKGCTTSKTKLFIIKLVKKLRLEEEAKLVRDIFKNIARLIKRIIKRFIKLFRVGSE